MERITEPCEGTEERPEVEQVIRAIEDAIGGWTGCGWCSPMTEVVRWDILDDNGYIDHWVDIELSADGEWSEFPGLGKMVDLSDYPDRVRGEILDAYFRLQKKHREYRDDVAVAAERAAEEGRDAIEYLRDGDNDAALGCLRRACSIEAEYGDCPIWGVPFRALREILEG